MNKRVRILLISAIVIFILSVIGTLFIFQKPEGNNIVIIQDGREIYHFDLNDTENQKIVIPSLDGESSNTVEIKDGKIRIIEAECPDKTCVKTGELKSENIPIVCLPNKLIIRFSEEDE